MAMARLKTPKGQRSSAPREDDKLKSAGPKFAIMPDPAEALYQAFANALQNKDKDGHRLKRWHELSVHDRRAWRAAHDTMRALVLSGMLLPIPAPPPDKATVLISDGNAYQSAQAPRSELPEDIITGLQEAIDQLYIENPDQQRPESGKDTQQEEA